MGPRRKAKNDELLNKLHRRYHGDIPREKLNGGKWRHDKVRDPLSEISHTQCVFCEQEIHNTRYKGEVEHFRPVAKYWWLAYTWENLLYACTICNGTKSDNFPLRGPKATAWGSLSQERPLLINPLDEDPHRYLTYEFSETGDPGKIIPKTARAKKKVELWNKLYGINRPVLKGKRRFELMKLRAVVASHEAWGGTYTETLKDYRNPEISEFTGMVEIYLSENNIVL